MAQFNRTDSPCVSTKIAALPALVLLEHAPLLIRKSGLDQQSIWFNATWLSFTGRSLEQERGHGWIAEMHPDDCRLHCQAYEQGYTLRTPVRVVYRLRHHTGQFRWISETGIPLLEESGGCRGFLSYGADVTEGRELAQQLGELQRRYDFLLNSDESGRKTLQASEVQFKAAFETMSVGYAQADLSGRYTRVNRRFCEMTGYSEVELLTMTYMDMTHPDDRELNRQQLAMVFCGKIDSFRIEKRYLRKDGAVWWGDLTVNVVRDEFGSPLWTMAVHYDVTARKTMETALKDSEQRWQFALNANADGVWDWTLSEQNAYLSPMYCEILGYRPGELSRTFDAWRDAIHPADRARVLDSFHRHLRGETEAFISEYRCRSKDQSYRWILDRGKVVVRAESGAPIRVVGTFADITARKELEEALAESQKRWQFALEGSGDGVWDWQVGEERVYVSPRWSEMLGYSFPDGVMTFKEWIACLHPDDGRKFQDEIARYLRGETALYSCELRVRTRNGRYRWMLDRGKVMAWSSTGQPLRMIGTHTDITFLKDLQASLVESQLRFSQAFHHAAIGMALVGLDGRWLMINSALCAILGYTEQELLALRFQDCTHPDELSADAADILALLQGHQKMTQRESRFLSKSGQIVWTQLNIASVPNGQGRPRYFIAQVQDITARRDVERALRGSEAQFVSFMDNFQGYAWIKDGAGRYVYGNHKWVEAIRGRLTSDGEGLGKTDADLFVGPLLQQRLKSDRQVLLRQRAVQDAEVWKESGGDAIWLVSKFPVLREDAEGPFIGGLAVDITQRARMQEALKKSRIRLRALQDEREQMSQDLHDNSIQSLYAIGIDLYECELILRENRAAEAIPIFQRSVDRINGVIRGLRQHLLSRGLPRVKTPAELAADIEELLKQANATGRTKFRAHIHKRAIASLDREQTVHVGAIIREAISNILRHAHARHGRIALTRAPGEVRLEITDDGRGMSTAGSRSSGRHGIKNMRARAACMKAGLSISSKKGPGTTIVLSIPIQDKRRMRGG